MLKLPSVRTKQPDPFVETVTVFPVESIGLTTLPKIKPYKTVVVEVSAIDKL